MSQPHSSRSRSALALGTVAAALFALAPRPASAVPFTVAPRAPSGTTAAASESPPETVGLVPLQLPDGLRGFADKLTAQLHDGALGLPRLRGLEAVARGACLFDEGGCLADLARSAKLARLVSGRVVQGDGSYAFELRLWSAADGRELGAQRGSVAGGPLDLAGGMEHGLCALLGGDPCEGSLKVRDESAGGAHLVIDDKDRGALPLTLALPVGRHLLRVGGDERRVRIALGRETRLVAVERSGALSLQDDDAPARASQNPSAPASALVSSSSAQPLAPDAALSPRSRAARLILAAGGALLMTSAGVELYARAQSAVLDGRYQSGQLTAADASSYGQVHTAGIAALLLAATGAGALATGGLLWLVSPGGAAVEGKF